MPKYNWILFDADDTLFDFNKSARHSFVRTLTAHDIKMEAHYFDIYETINSEAWHAFEKKEITTAQLRKIRFERFLDAIGEYRDPLEMNGFYIEELSKACFMIDGAVQLAEELLSKNFRLGLITNGLKEVQRPRIARAKVEHLFEVVVVSDEIGVAKPHAGFFEHTFSEMKNPDKSTVLVVGDNLNSDIQGGNNFGLHTCWYNPHKKANLTGHLPTYEIGKLEELRRTLFL